MSKKRIVAIIDKLQPYMNGGLITPVTIKYWNELKELLLNEKKKE